MMMTFITTTTTTTMLKYELVLLMACIIDRNWDTFPPFPYDSRGEWFEGPSPGLVTGLCISPRHEVIADNATKIQ